MAPRLKRWMPWVATPVAACAAVAALFVPPHRRVPSPRSWFWRPPHYASASRGQDAAARYANAWRRVTLRLDLERWRLRLEAALDSTRRSGPGSVIVRFAPGVSNTVREPIASAIDTLTRELGIRQTKVRLAVAVVPVDDHPRSSADSTPSPGDQLQSTAYLLPDSAHPSICIVRLAVHPVTWDRPFQRTLATHRLDPEFLGGIRTALGPCAFYAAFGVPGPEIGRWLAARGFDLARDPAWAGPPADTTTFLTVRNRPDDPDERQLRQFLYDWAPVDAAGCMAGERAACAHAVLATPGEDSEPGIVGAHRPWAFRIYNGDIFLSDLARAIGPRRFGEFWNSTLPVDRAFRVAADTGLADWALAWSRRRAPHLTAGAPVAAVPAGFALVLAAVGLTGAMALGRRRRPG